MVDPTPDLPGHPGEDPSAPAASANDADQASGRAPAQASQPEREPSRRGRWWSVDRSHAPDLLLAVAPLAGLTVAYSYAALTWHGLGVKPGDLSVDLTSIAPSAGLLAVCVGIGALLARVPLRSHLTKLVAYVVVVGACAAAWANTTVANIAGGVLGQAVAVVAVSLAVAKLLRWFGPDRSELPPTGKGFMVNPV